MAGWVFIVLGVEHVARVGPVGGGVWGAATDGVELRQEANTHMLTSVEDV